MKLYFSIFYFLFFTTIVLPYPTSLNASDDKQKWNMVSLPKKQIEIAPTISHPSTLERKEHKETTTAIYRLNQINFGNSEYEKAQGELQQFNRPVIGIVGKDNDTLSYQEYQKKILGSSY